MTMLWQLVQKNGVNIQQLRQKVRSLMESFGKTKNAQLQVSLRFNLLWFSCCIVSTLSDAFFYRSMCPDLLIVTVEFK